MPIRPLPFCIAASMVFGALGPASGQPVLPALVSPAGQPALAPPPDRVGRIESITGAVSFHLAGATEWQVASPNLPVTTGTGLWVGPAGEAAIGLGGGNRIVLGATTELDLDRLDDQALAATQAQGESYLHLRQVPPGETYGVKTPRGIVTIAAPGRYAIVSGDTEHPTLITVLEGAASLTGGPATAEIGPSQALAITGDGAATPFASTLGPATRDTFLRHVLAEERPPATATRRAPAIVAQMTGAEALDDVGEWSDNAEYGPVWYPPVAAYVPYRQGRWAYVAPWGWTWVDNAPWGFAPTHYGRWSQFDGRWGWVPGRDWAPGRRPAYAPALVGFLGAAALGFGRGPAVGWAPLGPRDAYRPPYAASDRAIQVLNQPTGANIRIVNAPVTINRSAITIVPPQVLTNSTQVAGALRPGPLPPSLGPASVLQFRPQAAPTRATTGVTQNVLRQINPPAQIGPAPLLGGAAIGAVAGGLLRPPPPRPAALPELRARGMSPPLQAERQRPLPAAARPLPPVMPAIIEGGPATPMIHRTGAPRLPQVFYPQPEPAFAAPRQQPPPHQPFAPQRQPPIQAPQPVAAPYRPAPPPLQRAAPPPPVQRAPPQPHQGRPER